MSDSLNNPFKLKTPDEAKELSTLIRAIDFARRFSLLIVRCNEPITRDRLIREIRAALPNLEIETVEFEKPIRNLFNELKARPESNPGAIFVTGLEHSIERDAPEKSPFIINLNHSRNGFGKFFNCPLVLWLPEFVVTAVAHGAPDFFSVRSGLYYFFAAPDTARPVVERHLSPEIHESYSMPLEEKRERITSIENLLNDFRSLPEEKRDLSEEADLLRRLGVLYESIGELDKAELQYREGIRIAESTHNEFLRAGFLGSVADILFARGELDEVLRIRREDELPIYEKLGGPKDSAVTWGRIADALEARGDLDKALWIRQSKELPVFEKLGDIRESAVTLGKVADILREIGDLKESLEILQTKVLPIFGQLFLEYEWAVTIGKIADIFETWGQLDKALQLQRKSALPVFEKLGNMREQAVTLGKIAHILSQRGDLDKALWILQNDVLPVFDKLGNLREVAVSLARMGDILMAQGNFPEARWNYEKAKGIFEKMKIPDAKHVETMLQNLKAAEKEQ